jgi:hypothetical protein
LVLRYPGTRPLLFALTPEKGVRVLLRAGLRYTVDPTPEFVAEARAIVGEEGVLLRAGSPKPRRDNGQRRYRAQPR